MGMTHITALAISRQLPKAKYHTHGHNWSWAYYDTKEQAEEVCAAMRTHGNRKWGHGRCDDPTEGEIGWCIHYHYDNHVSVEVDYERQRVIVANLKARMQEKLAQKKLDAQNNCAIIK